MEIGGVTATVHVTGDSATVTVAGVTATTKIDPQACRLDPSTSVDPQSCGVGVIFEQVSARANDACSGTLLKRLTSTCDSCGVDSFCTVTKQ